MYKNFNGSIDFSKNVFENFQKKKQINTKFGKDKKSYNQNQKQMKNINKKNVNLKKVKPDTDTSMPKPSSFTPKKIKTYGTVLGIIILCLVIWKFINWMIENQILIPVIISLCIIGFMIFTKFKKLILKRRR